MVACLLKMLVNTGVFFDFPGFLEVTQASEIQKYEQVTRWRNSYTKKQVQAYGITGGAILGMLPKCWARRRTCKA